MCQQWLQNNNNSENWAYVERISGTYLYIEKSVLGSVSGQETLHQSMEMSNIQCNCVDYCFGVRWKGDSVNRPTGPCRNCCCLRCRSYCVSCLMAIVIKDRFYGIELFTEGRCVFTRGPGLVGNPVRPCDVIQVYTKMKEDFTGGMNNVVMRNKDPVDSRCLQRCVDIAHWHLRQ